MDLGLEVFLKKHTADYKGKRAGLLTNLTGVSKQLEPAIDLFYHHSDIHLNALFGPEHGIRGEEKEGEKVASSADAYTGLPIYSLYSENHQSKEDILDDVDVVFCDLQDIGTRYYTFIYTMAELMEKCGKAGKQFVVLDRPNPINGIDIEGNFVQDAFTSFVGKYPIPVRHSMTIGELALLFKYQFHIACELKVIPMQGWSRSMYYDQTGLFWVSPTPNTTSLDMCLLYPGTCLIEGTNISEGRGTTKPFEMAGAPFVNGRELANTLNDLMLPGVLFRAAVFKPMYQKYAGEVCEGVQIHISDRSKINAYYIGLCLIEVFYKLYPNQFQFIRSADFDNLYFIDLLAGTDALRHQIIQGSIDCFLEGIATDTEQFKRIKKSYELYGSPS